MIGGYSYRHRSYYGRCSPEATAISDNYPYHWRMAFRESLENARMLVLNPADRERPPSDTTCAMARKRKRPARRVEPAAEREIRKLLVWMIGLLVAALLTLVKLCADK